MMAPTLAAVVMALAAQAAGANVLPGSGEFETVEFVVDGTLVGYSLPRLADGSRAIYVLVGPDRPKTAEEAKESEKAEQDAPTPMPDCPDDDSKAPTLQHLELSDPPRVSVIDVALPDDCGLDALDVDGDGAQELLLACDEVWSRIDVTGSRADLSSVLEADGLRRRGLRPIALEFPALEGVRWMIGSTPGRLALYGPEQGAKWAELASVELPVFGYARSNGLGVFSADAQPAGRLGDGTIWFATRPFAPDERRLRTMLVEVSPSGVASSTECWLRLPEPEQLLESEFVTLDGRPTLIVLTKPADRLGLFGEKRVRVYTLERDRSRLGRPARFATESRINLWQDAQVRLTDVNGDGREDLVLSYWKGMTDHKVVIDVYLREAKGSFASGPKTTARDVKDADRSFVLFGEDVNDDAVPDLVVRSENRLLVYAGLVSDDGKGLVEKKPHEIVLPAMDSPEASFSAGISPGGAFVGSISGAGMRTPVVIDLDGDGRNEMVVAGRDRLRVVRRD